MPYFLHTTFRCTHCKAKTRLKILRTQTDSFLPVEITNKNIPEDEIFDSKKHKSHLLNCPGLASEWRNKVKAFKKIEWKEEKELEKQFLS